MKLRYQLQRRERRLFCSPVPRWVPFAFSLVVLFFSSISVVLTFSPWAQKKKSDNLVLLELASLYINRPITVIFERYFCAFLHRRVVELLQFLPLKEYTRIMLRYNPIGTTLVKKKSRKSTFNLQKMPCSYVGRIVFLRICLVRRSPKTSYLWECLQVPVFKVPKTCIR